jgi:undecaprenyl-diphosphatase
MIRLIAAFDRKLLLRMNQWSVPAWLQRWMRLASRAGDGWLWVSVGFALLFFGGDRRREAIEAGIVSACAAAALFLTIKYVVSRERPCPPGTRRWEKLLPTDRFSFPSGHTMMAFAVAVTIGVFYPLLLPVLLFCALSVAASRVVLGLHYMSDVVAGVMIGAGTGLGVLDWFGRL